MRGRSQPELVAHGFFESYFNLILYYMILISRCSVASVPIFVCLSITSSATIRDTFHLKRNSIINSTLGIGTLYLFNRAILEFELDSCNHIIQIYMKKFYLPRIPMLLQGNQNPQQNFCSFIENGINLFRIKPLAWK